MVYIFSKVMIIITTSCIHRTPKRDYKVLKVSYDEWNLTMCSRFKKKKKLFVAFPWVETSTGPGGFMICVFII